MRADYITFLGIIDLVKKNPAQILLEIPAGSNILSNTLNERKSKGIVKFRSDFIA